MRTGFPVMKFFPCEPYRVWVCSVLEKMASTLVLSQNDDFDYKFKFEDNAMQLSLQYCKGFIWVI